MDYQQAWLLANRTKGLGVVKIRQLLSFFGSIEKIFHQTNYPEHLSLNASIKSALKSPDHKTIEPDLKWLNKNNNHLLALDNDLYPPLLKLADSPPPLLYATGKIDTLLLPQLAVVGSRNATPAGLKNTRSFCFDLAKNNLCITSGMALGVDGMAHRAALDANGTTVAVMGTGLDVVYPARHKDLAHDIAQNGVLLSEFPTGTRPHSFNFPRRNRIICGLSLGTLVVEAGIQSGTLITARQTMEINRPVMAIPGSIHSPLAKGCHLLIKQGAKLVESAQEILEELTPLAQSLSLQIKEKLFSLEEKTVKSDRNPYISDQNEEHHALLQHILFEPTAIDKIIAKSKMSAQEVSSILLILELEDKIQALPGANYIRL